MSAYSAASALQPRAAREFSRGCPKNLSGSSACAHDCTWVQGRCRFGSSSRKRLRPSPRRAMRSSATRGAPAGLYFGRNVIRSVSLPSAEREMYFSVSWISIAVHPEALHEIPLLFALLVAPPVVSTTEISTLVPRQTGIRLAVFLSSSGLTMFPVCRMSAKSPKVGELRSSSCGPSARGRSDQAFGIDVRNRMGAASVTGRFRRRRAVRATAARGCSKILSGAPGMLLRCNLCAACKAFRRAFRCLQTPRRDVARHEVGTALALLAGRRKP